MTKTASIPPIFKRLAALAGLLGLAFALNPIQAAANEVGLQEIYGKLNIERPVQVNIPPDGTERKFLVLQNGRIWVLPKDESAGEAKVFLDISNRNLIDNAFEEGLLNITFHPKFADNGKFYVYYSHQNPKRSVISEMTVREDDPNKADLDSERILMEVRQPFWNHNSGNMLFGSDGMLFIALGDGGKANDPHRLAQNLWVLNGKLLRIDVDSKDGALEYGIPADNPFAKTNGVRPEIWAYGLRNPWGLHIDEETGLFWLADVGQNKYEEIDLIEKGGNYGWNYREGFHDFEPNRIPEPPDANFIEPIHEYPRTDGISITGGLVYRGDAIPSLKGYYIYGDWGSGNVWALKYEDGEVKENKLIYKREEGVPFQPTAFNVDENGEILALSHNGSIFRIVPKN